MDKHFFVSYIYVTMCIQYTSMDATIRSIIGLLSTLEFASCYEKMRYEYCLILNNKKIKW